MSLIEITNKVNELASSWEQFKAINDRRLSEIERRGSADPLTLEQVQKLNDVIDTYQQNLARVETVLQRPRPAQDSDLNSKEHLAYRQAFCSYLRKGHENNLIQLERKALSASAETEGGFLVTPYMAETMLKTIEEASPLRQIANTTIISTDALELIEDCDSAASGWAQELEARIDTKTPQIGKKVIAVHELYAQPKATQKLIDDASVDIESWLAGKLSDSFASMENAAFINGDGVGKPRGILAYNAGKKWGEIEQILSGSNGAITAESLFSLYFSLKETYAVKAKFMMGRASVQTVRMLKDTTNGAYLWQPGLALGDPDTLLGAAVIQCAQMPGLQKGSLAIVCADFKAAYQIVDRQGIRLLRDPFTDKPFVKFYTTKRVGGDVTNFEAIKLLKLSAVA